VSGERLAASEARGARTREEIQSLRLQLQEAEVLLRTSRAEAAAARMDRNRGTEAHSEVAALKADLEEERQKSQQERLNAKRQRERYERKLQDHEEELRIAKDRAEHREREQDAQIGDLRRQLQDLQEAHHHREVSEVIQAAAQEIQLLPSGHGDSARRRLFSPSLLTPASESSTFVFEGASELVVASSGGSKPPPPPPPLISPPPPPPEPAQASGSAGSMVAGGVFGCSPLFGVPLLVKSPTLKSPMEELPSTGSGHRHRASIVSSLDPSSGGGTAPLETPGCASSTGSQSTAGLRTRARGSLGGIGECPLSRFSPESPPVEEVAAPPVAHEEVRSFGTAPELMRQPSDLSDHAPAVSAATAPSLSRSSSRSSCRHVTPPPSVGRWEAPPPGCVAEKVSIFEQRCQTPTPPQGPATPIPEALRHGPRSEPVPTPIGRQQRRSNEGLIDAHREGIASTSSIATLEASRAAQALPESGGGRNSFSTASLASTFAVPPSAPLAQQDLDAPGTRELLEGPSEPQLEELVASPPMPKECRRRLSWPGTVDGDAESLIEF